MTGSRDNPRHLTGSSAGGKHAFVLFLLLFLCVTLPAAEFEICRFPEDKTSAVSLTFDDGKRDHLLHAVPLLEKYGFRGTFYIIAGRVPEKADSWINAPMCWAEIRMIAQRGHEIGNHSLNHRRPLTKEANDEDIRREINAPIPVFQEKAGIRIRTFCYPGCSNTPKIEKIVLEKHLAASRRRYPCGGEKFTLELWKGYLDEVEAKHQAAAMMIHAVHPQSGYKPFSSLELFEACLQELKQREKRIYVAPYAEVACYVLLRDASRIKALGNGEFELICSRPDGSKLGFLSVKYTGSVPAVIRQEKRETPASPQEILQLKPGKFTVQTIQHEKNL